MVNHKYLMKPSNSPLKPGRLEVDGVGVAADQMLRENHDKALKDDEEKVLLVCLSRLKAILQLFNLSTKDILEEYEGRGKIQQRRVEILKVLKGDRTK